LRVRNRLSNRTGIQNIYEDEVVQKLVERKQKNVKSKEQNKAKRRAIIHAEKQRSGKNGKK